MGGLQEEVRSDVQEAAKLSVLVTVPNTGWLHKTTVLALLRLQTDRRYRLRISLPTAVPLENNQHGIIKDFLGGGEDYWLSIDSDSAPIENPLDLVALDLDIIGLPYPIWHYTSKPGERPIYWAAYDYVEAEDAYREHEPKDGLQRVDAIGGGAMLIARRVFEHPEMQKGAFTRTLNGDGTVEKGNDIAFCERARTAGFKVWSHYGYPAMHTNELELTEIIRAFQGIG